MSSATVFTLYAPVLDAGGAASRALRRGMSWALTRAWPRIRCFSREEFYREAHPDTCAPLALLRIDGGQEDFERRLKNRRTHLVPPGSITGYELECHLVDVWTFHRWNGRFTILRLEAADAARAGAAVVYVDPVSREWGPLLGPISPRWVPPPYGFPALFFVPLNSGGMLWLRLHVAEELRVCYRAPRGGETHHLSAFRAAPRRDRSTREPVVVSFLGVCMLHAFADGNCYLPLVQDFLTLYEAAVEGSEPQLPPLPCPFEELQRRLFDTFLCRANPARSSIRGSLFRYSGRGFGHNIGMMPGAMVALARASMTYRVPLDVALLGLVVCANARADAEEAVDLTLYTPMRDGPGEAMTVGLFSDWRDLALHVDFDLATTLGTVLQVSHKVHHRQWSVFNALRKPDRTIVNIQPLDFQRRSGFINLGENLFHGGDRIGTAEKRGDELEWARQPATFVIEQQDEVTWWILVSASETSGRPPPWMRRFIFALREALESFLFEPLARVHGRMPDDDELLQEHAAQATQ